jgi:class 3 adenylate cyclase
VPQERKIVTVLFADIVDSSGTTRSYDPEILRAALGRTFARTREILIEHGATVEKFIGDAVMAVFGVPSAHEDDAERAVRAAIALRAEVSPSSTQEGPRFTLRIGINSGEVVTGDGEGAEFLVTGGPVIVGARLEENAQPGEILVGSLTRVMTRERIAYGPPRVIETKGMGPIDAATVTGVIDASTGRGRLRSPFVGRDAELRLLGEIHGRLAATGRAHVVTVFGDAGIGKSRLASEFVGRVSPDRAARVTCLPYGHAITYWPLQELIRGDAGVTPTDAREVARGKIETKVAGLVGDEAEARAIAHSLTGLALGDEGDAPTELSPDQRRHDLALALSSYLEARLAGTPAIIVLEDLHWAEEPLLALLEELLDHVHAPLLLLCLARPDLLVRRSTWGSGRTNAIALSLEPLRVRDTELLARHLLRSGAPQRVGEIVARTEGNPLFVEEYVHMILDQGSSTIVPPTLHGVIAARIDGTSAPAKQLLQEASVLGRDFWLDALPSNFSGTTAVDEAEQRGLVAVSGTRGPSGSHTLYFRHGLIRDVAYASLSKSERSRAHDHYSHWLQEATGERGAEYAEVVAYHAERAFLLAHELDASEGHELGRRAFPLLSRTAFAASGRGDLRAARTLNDRALAVADAVGVSEQEHAAAQALRAIIALRLDADAAAVIELDRAIEAERAIGPSEDLIRLLVWKASSVTIFEDLEASDRLFHEAIEVARSVGSDDLVAYAAWAASEPVGVAGDLDKQARLLEEALTQIRAAGATQYEVSCLSDMSLNAVERGDLDRADQFASDAVRLGRVGGRRRDRFRAAHARARTLLAAGDSHALGAADEAFELAREIGGPGALARAAEVLALAREQAGDAGAAESLLIEVLAELDPARMPNQREAIAHLEAIRSRLALARGDLAEARKAAATAVEVAPRTHLAARGMANLAAAALARAENRASDARRLVDETLAFLAPTQLRTLRARAEQMLDHAAARSDAR